MYLYLLTQKDNFDILKPSSNGRFGAITDITIELFEEHVLRNEVSHHEGDTDLIQFTGNQL